MVKTYHGACYCGAVKWEFALDKPEDGRTSLCHCENCKRWFGSNYGMLIKVPWDRFKWSPGSAEPRTHVSDNKGHALTRQFCGECGGGVRDFSDGAEGKFTYVCYGGMDDEARKDLPPKAEFFVSKREPWCQDVKGDDVYRPNELHE